MANKVITVGGGKVERPKKDPEATYLDVSMKSVPYRTAPSGVHHASIKSTWKVEKLTDTMAVRNSVHNIFTWIPGQRILNPEFGNKIREYLYEGMTNFTSDQVIAEIKKAIELWEPRVEIDDITRSDTVEENEQNEIDIVVIYHVKGLPEEKYSEPIIFGRTSID